MATAIEALATGALLAMKAPFTAWERFDHKARRQEIGYRQAALLLFKRERESIAARIEKAVTQFKANGGQLKTDWVHRPDWMPPESKAVPDEPHPSVTDPYVEAAVLLVAGDYAPGGAYHEAWLRRYRELLTRTVALGGASVAAETGLRFNLRNPRAIDAINRRALRLTGNVTETSLRRVRDVLATAREEGIGVLETAKRIRRDAFGGD